MPPPPIALATAEAVCVVHPAPQRRKDAPGPALVAFPAVPKGSQPPWGFMRCPSTLPQSSQSRKRAGGGWPWPSVFAQRVDSRQRL